MESNTSRWFQAGAVTPQECSPLSIAASPVSTHPCRKEVRSGSLPSSRRLSIAPPGQEGRMRALRKSCEAPLTRADGVVDQALFDLPPRRFAPPRLSRRGDGFLTPPPPENYLASTRHRSCACASKICSCSAQSRAHGSLVIAAWSPGSGYTESCSR